MRVRCDERHFYQRGCATVGKEYDVAETVEGGKYYKITGDKGYIVTLPARWFSVVADVDGESTKTREG